jgi:hypothetical protein
MQKILEIEGALKRSRLIFNTNLLWEEKEMKLLLLIF